MKYFSRFIPRRLRLQLKGLLNYSGYADLNFHLKVPQATNKKHFHFANIVGSHRVSNLIEPSLAKFLVLRGHTVSVTICDGALPACLACSIWLQPQKHQTDADFIPPSKMGICSGCSKPSIKTWRSTGAKIFYLSEHETSNKDYIIKNDYDAQILRINDIDLSEDVIAGCLRFLCKGDTTSITQNLWTHYAEAAIKIYQFYDKLLDQQAFDLVFSVHGIYLPHGITNKIFQSRNIQFYNYNTSYRQQRFYFTRNETYHKVLPAETDTQLQLNTVAPKDIVNIKKYLESREIGSEDWQQFNNEPNNNIKSYLQAKNFDFKNQTAVLFSNVVWDARLHFSENTYPDMIEWLRETVLAFKDMPDRNLIIRTHPGEVVSHSKSRDRLRDLPFITDLPPNIYFIDAEEKISSYGLARISSLNLIYASKIGMELSRMDAPIITCGDAWVKNKNATITPTSKDDYKLLLHGPWEGLVKQYDPRNGLAYAHYIFEEKPLHFTFLKPTPDRKSFEINQESLKKSILNFRSNDLSRVEHSDSTLI